MDAVQQAGEPTDEQIDKVFEILRYDAGYSTHGELARALFALYASRPQQPQAETPLTEAAQRVLHECQIANADPGTRDGQFRRDVEAVARAALSNTGARPSEAQEPQAKYDDTLLPFLALMRRELHANSGKGDRPGWLTMSREQGLLEIYWHAAKLSVAVKKSDEAAIAEHSADVANMAMMLADVCGVLAHPNTGAHPPEAEPT